MLISEFRYDGVRWETTLTTRMLRPHNKHYVDENDKVYIDTVRSEKQQARCPKTGATQDSPQYMQHSQTSRGKRLQSYSACLAKEATATSAREATTASSASEKAAEVTTQPITDLATVPL